MLTSQQMLQHKDLIRMLQKYDNILQLIVPIYILPKFLSNAREKSIKFFYLVPIRYNHGPGEEKIETHRKSQNNILIYTGTKGLGKRSRGLKIPAPGRCKYGDL